MSPEDLAGFDWMLDGFDQLVADLMILTAPMFESIANSVRPMVPGISYAMLALAMLNVARAGIFRTLGFCAVTWFVLGWGLNPTSIQISESASVQTPKIVWAGYQLAIGTRQVLGLGVTGLAERMGANGAIMPSAAIKQAAADRAAAVFQGTDLARLVRDYNAQCTPDGAVVQDGSISLEALHAIGLAGGSGLGIPDEEVGFIAQATATYSGALSAIRVLGGNLGSMDGVWDGVNKRLDFSAIRSRRAQGREFLEQQGRGFEPSGSRPYLLPSQQHWAGVYEKRSTAESENSYLSLADAPFDLEPVAWPAGGAQGSSQGFYPGTCVDAYRTAQFAAEQAYQGLLASGGRPSSGQRADTEGGRVAAALAWQRALNRSMTGSAEGEGGWTAVAGGIAVVQGVKNEVAWLEMYSYLPAYVTGLAVLLWLLLLIAPIFMLSTAVLGFRGFQTWLGGVLFTALAIVFTQFLVIGTSFAMSGAAVYQSALASGWAGNGTDIDMIMGVLQWAGMFIICASTVAAGWVTGFSVGPLGAAAAAAVATTSSLASGIVSVAGGWRAASTMVRRAVADKEDKKNPGRGGGGGGGGGNPGSGGGAGAAAASRTVRALHQRTTMTSHHTSRPRTGDDARTRQNWEQMRRRLGEKVSLIPPKEPE